MIPLVLLVLLGVVPLAPPHRGLHERIAELSAHLDEEPDDADAWLTRADLHRRHGDLPAAREDLEHARTLDDCPGRADLVDAELHFDAGRFDAALALFEQHLGRTPADGHAARQRARCLEGQGRLAEAHAAWDALLTDVTSTPSPDDYMERLELGLRVVTWTPTQRLRHGRAGLDAGLARLGPSPALQLRALELSEQLGEVDDALARLDRLASHSPRQERWLAQRGDILARAGRHADAHDAYAAALAALTDLSPRHRDTTAMRKLRAHVETRLQAPTAADSPEPVDP